MDNKKLKYMEGGIEITINGRPFSVSEYYEGTFKTEDGEEVDFTLINHEWEGLEDHIEIEILDTSHIQNRDNFDEEKVINRIKDKFNEIRAEQ